MKRQNFTVWKRAYEMDSAVVSSRTGSSPVSDTKWRCLNGSKIIYILKTDKQNRIVPLWIYLVIIIEEHWIFNLKIDLHLMFIWWLSAVESLSAVVKLFSHARKILLRPYGKSFVRLSFGNFPGLTYSFYWLRGSFWKVRKFYFPFCAFGKKTQDSPQQPASSKPFKNLAVFQQNPQWVRLILKSLRVVLALEIPDL